MDTWSGELVVLVEASSTLLGIAVQEGRDSGGSPYLVGSGRKAIRFVI